MPAVTLPPGELMYSVMSFSGSSAASSSSCAVISLALVSRTSEPRMMIRSRSSRSDTESDSDMPGCRASAGR